VVLTVTEEMTPEKATAVGDPITSWQVKPVLPSGLLLNAQTGEISGRPTLIQAAKEYTLTAANTGGSTEFKQFITVHAAPLKFTYDHQDKQVSWDWTQGHSYKKVPTINPASLAGGAVVTFSVKPTTMPEGLYFNPATGEFSGTPTRLSLGGNSFNVTATDTGGSTHILVKIRVHAVAPKLSYGDAPQTYIHKTCIDGLDATNAAGPYAAITKCSIAPALPRGLTLNTATCAITGCPAQISWPAQSYTVTGSNSGGSASAVVTLGVKAIAPVLLIYTGGASEVLTVGTAISLDEALIDEDSDPIIVNTVVPALPAGLSFNAKDGIVTGTPTHVTPKKKYTFTASNSGGAISYSQFITVNAVAPKDLTYDGGNTSMIFTLGHSVTERPSLNHASMTGGASLAFTIDKDLPAGLVMSATTGVISGKPTALSVSFVNYTVTATNSGGSTSVVLTLRVIAVCPRISFATNPIVLTHMRDALSEHIVNAGGSKAAVVICAVTPALPSGLTLNGATCGLSGMPEAISWPPITYSVVGANSCGSSATTMSLGVKAIPPTTSHWSGGADETLTVNNVTRVQIPTVNGDPITSWTVVPALPAGLAYDSTTGRISGTPTHVQAAR
jgi:hypothetical protein